MSFYRVIVVFQTMEPSSPNPVTEYRSLSDYNRFGGVSLQ